MDGLAAFDTELLVARVQNVLVLARGIGLANHKHIRTLRAADLLSGEPFLDVKPNRTRRTDQDSGMRLGSSNRERNLGLVAEGGGRVPR